MRRLLRLSALLAAGRPPATPAHSPAGTPRPVLGLQRRTPDAPLSVPKRCAPCAGLPASLGALQASRFPRLVAWQLA